MYAYNIDSPGYTKGDCSRCPPNPFIGLDMQRVADKRFARGTHENRKTEYPQFREPVKQFEILGDSFPKTNTRINDDVLFSDSSIQSQVDGCTQFFDHVGHEVVVLHADVPSPQRLGAGHILGAAAIVHDHDRHLVRGDDAGHVRVHAQAPHVVDHLCAGPKGAVGHLGLGRVHRNRYSNAAGQRLDDREYARALGFHCYRGSVRSRRFAADVEDVYAGIHEGLGLGKGTFGDFLQRSVTPQTVAGK